MSEHPPHALMRPAIALPFLLVALIWGSTWFVITTQIGEVPAYWSVTWRFAVAAPAMFLLALAMRHKLAMPRAAHMLALAMGLFQFCGNYVFVYMSELYLTSGIVALLIGMMIVPNAILGRVMLGQAITARFTVGSAIALAGIALLLVNEAQVAPRGG
ncbi:MAG: DMT family transporter, partial [Erythrobacter sp.]